MIKDYNTYKKILPIIKELKEVYNYINDENFDMFRDYSTWQFYVQKIYSVSSREKYKYFFTVVLSDQNFCDNFKKIIQMDIREIEQKKKNIHNFYRNSYILFLLQLRNS